MRWWILLGVVVFAGCVEPAETSDVTASLHDDYRAWFDETAAVDRWAEFVKEHAKRDTYLPSNGAAREDLIGRLQTMGFSVEVRSYERAPRGLAEAPVHVYAIEATLAGDDPVTQDGLRHRIGLVSHFDTVATTIEGAYDDGSGVHAELTICEALAKRPMDRDLTCLFFDAEEQGLVASEAYVQDVTAGDEDFAYDLVIGYDMVGLNWPGHAWKLYLMTGPAEAVPWLKPFGEQVMHAEMAYPTEGVEVLDTHDRNSDERHFREAGIPIYRFAGGRHASDYPEYHMPGDTVEYVYDFAGGRDNFEAGFATVIEASLALITAFDDTSGVRL